MHRRDRRRRIRQPIPVVRLQCRPGLELPAYQTPGASGADIAADLEVELIIPAGAHRIVPTGLTLAIPRGYEVQVRPRSGLAARSGVTVLNSPGTIDADYRGEVRVILMNLGRAPVTVRPGDRIAQLVVAPTTRAAFYRGKIGATSRGPGGFGSTGL